MNVITVEKIYEAGQESGAYIQINNLLVEVKVSSDNQGYIVDIFNNDTEDLIETIPIWKDDMESNEEEM